MPKSIHTPESPEAASTRYASFIVRCWQDGEARLRARLVDVNTGVSYPVANLSDLPALLSRLLRQMGALSPPPDDSGISS
ncbi:MAG TPA: hypothetical protein PKH77_23655 [Anaerolineae bacterium]|nr:hypothetical protein [Anaerolineae bacterium]